ncbi:MAG: YqgE/AlgH family protein, partial [Oceanobacter sp.]
ETTCVTSSKDILSAIAAGSGPGKFRLMLGYAGWSEGQLDGELRDNAWLTLKADDELLFGTPPEELYQASLARLGVDSHFLSVTGGRA